ITPPVPPPSLSAAVPPDAAPSRRPVGASPGWAGRLPIAPTTASLSCSSSRATDCEGAALAVAAAVATGSAVGVVTTAGGGGGGIEGPQAQVKRSRRSRRRTQEANPVPWRPSSISARAAWAREPRAPRAAGLGFRAQAARVEMPGGFGEPDQPRLRREDLPGG